MNARILIKIFDAPKKEKCNEEFIHLIYNAYNKPSFWYAIVKADIKDT